MMKYSLLMIFLLLSLSIVAQQDPVLMCVNGKEIPRSEFEYAYNKTKLAGIEQKSLKDYAEQFANFKLKIAAAEASGVDTTQAFGDELNEYRRQLVKTYFIDEATMERSARQYYDKMKTGRRAGRIRVSHIFKYIPQNISGLTLRSLESNMDSIYDALRKGGESVTFETFVKKFSDEKNSFWVGWLQMPLEFEDVVFGMQVGEVSRPFFTPQGIHIVKVLERKEDLSFEKLKKEIIRNQTRCDRMSLGTEALVEKLKKEYRYRSDKSAVDELLAKGQTTRTLFTLEDKVYTGKDFARFAATHPEGIQRQLDGFIVKSVLSYENEHLTQKHPEFRIRMQEHRDSMLLCAISNRELGKQDKVNESGMNAYFEEHRSNYHWKEPRYKGIVLHCVSKRVAKNVRKLLKQLPYQEWQDAIRLTFNAGSVPQIQFELGLFAPGDNVYVDELIFSGKETSPILSFPFTVVVGKKLKGPDDYQMVRNQLVIDYQNHLERHWIAKLRASGKVEINQEVLKTVNNH